MKKPFPYFRHIEDTSDGCWAGECLACGAKWEARRISTNYCGSCGINFVCEHEYVRKERPNLRRVIDSRWIIEGRRVSEYKDDGYPRGWICVQDCQNMHRHYALDLLRRYRAQEAWGNERFIEVTECSSLGIRIEFRLRLVSGEIKCEYQSWAPYPSEMKYIENNRAEWLKEREESEAKSENQSDGNSDQSQ